MIAIGPAKQITGRDRALAWLGGAGAALAWILHLGIAYWYAEGACQNATAVGSIEPVVVALTVVLAAVAVAASLAALSIWRGARGERLPDPRGRLEFMGLAGLLGGVVFGFAIVIQGVQVLALDPCLAG